MKSTLPAICRPSGSSAPDFTLVDADLHDRSLQDYKGKKKLLNIVPSLDTPVCATSTKKFNEAAKSNDGVVMLIISADLPFAMSRFCTGENLDNVIPLAMMRSRNFAERLRRADYRRPACRHYVPSGGGAG